MDRTPAATTTRVPTVLAVVATVLVGAGVTALTWWRLGPVTRGTVWAEDGGVFLRDRVALGPVDSLLHPYAGYLHLVPRLLVDLGWAMPIEDYAHVVPKWAAGPASVPTKPSRPANADISRPSRAAPTRAR